MQAKISTYIGVCAPAPDWAAWFFGGNNFRPGDTVAVMINYYNDNEIVHVTIHNPITGALCAAQVIMTKAQLNNMVVPINTNISKVLYGQ